MAKLGYRERTLLPDGKFFRFRVLSAKIDEEGKYGAQLALELKVLGGGAYGGHVFTDWSKLAADEDTGQVFVVEDGKAEEIFAAAGVDPREADPGELAGKILMARAGVSDNGKRNRLEYGSIGAVPEDEEVEQSGLRRAHEEMRKDSTVPAAPAGYVEGEDEPPPEEY